MGCLLIVLWMIWAYDGDLRDFTGRAVDRAGAGTVTRHTLQWSGSRRATSATCFPSGGALVVLVAALGLLDCRTRSLTAASLGTVLALAVLFRNGAYDHNYWLYCILLSLALGAAVAADALSRWATRMSLPRACAGLALGEVLAAALWHPCTKNGNGTSPRIGAEARALSWPAGQRYAYHAFGGRGATTFCPACGSTRGGSGSASKARSPFRAERSCCASGREADCSSG
jgi:hypothetical protein